MSTEKKINDLLDVIQKLESEIEDKNKLINDLSKNLQSLDLDSSKRLNELVLINRIISHDLANPISIIQMCSEFISEQAIDEQTRSMVEKIERSALAMNNILKQSREIQAIYSGKKNLQISKIKISELVNEIKFQFLDKLQEKKIKLEIENNFEFDASINSDKDILINNILSRIIDNSIKYSNEGSTISMKFLPLDGQISLSIQDHGIGMDKETINNLFNLDKKYSRQGTKGENGYFLSMPIISQSMRLLNIKSQISSCSEKVDQNSHGTTFELILNKAS